MRLLHPKTLNIVGLSMIDIEFNTSTVSRKQIIAHAWSEVLKYLATKQSHPKMFLSDADLGVYMALVKKVGDHVGCNLNSELLKKYDVVWERFNQYKDLTITGLTVTVDSSSFDSHYLFSDAISLYFKGCNIMPYIYSSEGQWRKYVPIENLKEIHRVVGKTLDKEKKQ